ncbi:MAG: hypothetical protein ACRDGA_04675 [Bacteroidota bacterium]
MDNQWDDDMDHLFQGFLEVLREVFSGKEVIIPIEGGTVTLKHVWLASNAVEDELSKLRRRGCG